ncbi:BspA family leucine-rich repeat surface protein, partial [Carnobacterium maltaromaticum]
SSEDETSTEYNEISEMNESELEAEQEKQQVSETGTSNKEIRNEDSSSENTEDETGSPIMVENVLASGTNGTSNWQVFEDGLLLIGAGTLASTTASISPWLSQNTNIRRIEFEPGVRANTNVGGLFRNLTNVTEIDLTNFDTSDTTNMSNMFSDMRSLTELDLSNFNTSKVMNMQAMFSSMSSLTELDLTSFNTSNVLNMSAMFSNMSSLTELDVKSFDTSKVTDMNNMFMSMRSLTALDLRGFDTSNVLSMNNMFNGMRSLIELDLTSFNTSKVTSMGTMFASMNVLSKFTLGNEFRFVGTTTARLPEITQSGYTGRWVGLNTGTAFGSSSLLMTDFAGEADTYVWEESRILEVKVPVKTLFSSNQEDPTQIESSTYTLTNQSTHPVHVTVASVKDERNIEDIELLQMNGISLIENGETTLVEEHLLGTLPLGGQQPFSYTGQARQVTNEVNPSFNLVLKFSFLMRGEEETKFTH